MGAGEMVEQLTACVALAEVWVFFPVPTCWLIPSVIAVPGGSDALF